ncbi:MAG: phosphatase PAP2 family protein [Candidatus Yanofskybacteria bacterium]|nr:phosphatase PAP2 family protein [Candidatus Yanofskybacteria bacterium]
MDLAISNYVTGFLGRWPMLDRAAFFFADTTLYILVLGALIYAAIPKQQTKERMLIFAALLTGILSRFGITSIIRLFYSRPRPSLVIANLKPLIDLDVSQFHKSFPSGHAAFFFAFAGVIYCYHPRWGKWLFLVSTLMGLSRVFAGVHWFSDIVGGAVVGMGSAWLMYHFVLRRSRWLTS